MISLPTEVKIGPYTYKIVERDREWFEDTEAYGNTWTEKKIINIALVGDEISQLDTLLHECLHALWAFYYLDDHAKEEEVVSKIATGMIMLFVQNPDLLGLYYEYLYG
jgi:hypothetical protein